MKNAVKLRSELAIDYGRFVRALAKQSVCKRRGVAAIVVDSYDWQPIAWGVNGPAEYDEKGCSGQKDGCGCAHSEINTLNNCNAKVDRDLSGILILTRAPCVPCATAIVNCGFIGSVLYMDESEPGAHGLSIVRNCGIAVQRLVVPEQAEIGLRDPAMEPSKPKIFTWTCANCDHDLDVDSDVGQGQCSNPDCAKYRIRISLPC